MSDKNSVVHGLNIRAWYVEGGVHPLRAPEFLALGKFGDPSQSDGDPTRISAPDPTNFNRDIQVGTVPGTTERASLTISNRYTTARAILLRLYRKKCRVDFFAMVGICGNPQNFSKGGEKFVYFPDGKPSSHDIENFGAFGKDETGASNENMPMTAEEYWEFVKMGYSELGSATTTREIMTIDVCDDVSCGDCDRDSDGCQRVLATMAGVGATPGTQPTLVYSDDNGVTWSTQTITSMFSNETVADAHCIGGNLVLITSQGNQIHYTSVDEIYLGTNVWTDGVTGFVVGGEPLSIDSPDASHTWIVGNGGYIYFTRNPTASVSVQDAGVATTQNLNDVHAHDTFNVLAVGNSNAVVFTRNGGETWEAATGPAAGINLSTCWMWDDDTWIVGEGAGGNGRLWATDDAGVTWTQLELPASVTRIDDIEFSSEAEGFVAVRVGSVGRIYRTVTAGNIWELLPDDGNGTTPDTDYFNDLAVCEKDSNTVFGGGLDGDGTTGIILKAEGAQ